MTTFTVNAAAVRAAQACQATNDIPTYMNGVCFLADGRVAGTNGHVLAAYMPYEPSEWTEEMIFAIDGKVPIGAHTLTFDTEQMTMRTERGKLFAIRRIAESYPDIDRIIPSLPRVQHSSGFCMDPSYLAMVEKVFGRHVDMHVYPGTARDSVLMRCVQAEGTQLLVAMPRRSGNDDFYPLERAD